MKTELVFLNALLLGGVDFYGDPFRLKGGWDSDNEIGNTCRRFVEYVTENPVRPYTADKQVFYEVHIYGKETADKGCFEVFVGEEVKSSALPIDVCAKYIAASDYLKVTLTGAEITEDWWKKLDAEFLPPYGVKKLDTYMIQAYDERFKGMEHLEASEIDVYIPIVKP
jgi:predicted transcriptional regulator YdeE